MTRALLTRARGSGHDFLDVFGLPSQSRLAAALDPGDACLIERVEAPILNLDGGFAAVAARKLSPSRRKKLRQRRRRLERLGRLELAVCRTPDELELAFTDALAVHCLRWRGRPDGSDLGTAAGARFQRAALLELAKHDIPRIVTLRLDGRLIAFQYYFALANRMYGHRGAFDPEFAAHSPGLICRYEALSAGADEGLRRVEFLGGGEEYKLELADGSDPLYQALGLASTARGRVAVYSRVASIRLRQRLKHSNTIRRLYVDGLAPARRIADRVLPTRRT